ncbi:unnamed protein product [Alternaria alternata]
MSETGIKTSQRVSRSCVECSRRKIRCDKKSPCNPCVRRNAGNSCRRPIVRVRGQLTVYADSDAGSAEDVQLEDLLRERGALRAQIAELETALALSKPCAHSRTSESTDYSAPSASLEDLVPAFEQFDIGITTNGPREGGEKDLIDSLYEPAADPIYLLLPSKDASVQLVTFSLHRLGWLHCAVDADVFFGEHEDFWQGTQLGTGIERERRPWLVVYLAVLAVGILYSDPEEIPDVTQLPQLGMPLADPVSIAVHTSRLWYEAALKELERYGFAGSPSLPVVQALSVLTLSRVLIPKDAEDDPINSRHLALQWANRILNYYAAPAPRMYRLVWVVSASTVASAIYVSLDMLANPHDYRGDAKLRIINLLRMAFLELKKHSEVAIHAAKGSAVLEGLLPVLERHDTELPGVPRTIHELLQQLSMAAHSTSNDLSNSAPAMDGFAHHGNYENIDMFDGIGNTLQETFAFEDWDEVFAQM